MGVAHVGAGIEAEAVREVAGRLLEEGRSRLETAPESALVALRQAFSLEQQFGVDGERLCCVCASVCHALSRIAQPYAPVAAVEPLVQGIETLDEMKAKRDAGQPVTVLDGHSEFLARELLGLARQLSQPSGSKDGPKQLPTLEQLRAADKAYDVLVAATRTAPLPLSQSTLVAPQLSRRAHRPPPRLLAPKPAAPHRGHTHAASPSSCSG